MIFRRIKAHIEKENWFAELIDFIKLEGVIGIQVANWIQSQTLYDRETPFLKELNVKFKWRLIPPQQG